MSSSGDNLTVQQLKKFLKENKVEFEKYRRKQYYVALYNEKVVGNDSITLLSKTTTTDSSSATPKDVQPRPGSKTPQRSKTPSRTPSSATKRSLTPGSVVKRKRKNVEVETTDDSNSRAKEPPKKRQKEQSKEESVKDTGKKSSLRIATEQQINQLRVNAQDITPMPKLPTQNAQRKRFSTPKQSRVSNKRQPAKAPSSDQNLKKETQEITQKSSLLGIESETQGKEEEGEGEDKLKLAPSDDAEDEGESVSEQSRGVMSFILRLAVVSMVAAVCFIAIFVFNSRPDQNALNIFESRITGRKQCDGESNSNCKPVIPQEITDMASDAQNLFKIESGDTPGDICGIANVVIPQSKLKKLLIEKNAIYAEHFGEFIKFIADGHLYQFTITNTKENDSLVSTRAPSNLHCLALKAWNWIRTYRLLVLGALGIIMALFIAGKYDQDTERITELRSLAIYHLKQQKKMHEDELRDDLKKNYPAVFSNDAWENTTKVLREDPRVAVPEEHTFEWTD